ncbi:DUF3349 domain-containing protein [Modestobacter sp. I12A-02628]|uniref:DUF3349 domain-containing protein n=1 Tax=Goekera deserti TaxID=2497753 RepID=A0A7K3WGQ8_9ACTN|nr:DUF3349 domain-containing protein [Goekera deserti]MPQ99358.1 DUF3349 domain-containing protein [Goekera deserti]NDI50357.1 DUF3349 domain-containing protein [Goekera deserti]NEL55685.1 DUF3349 domain-containing protein [Goekera deserti]
MTSSSPSLAGRVVDWLRAGYPTGVPEQDYVVLLGLLRRKLTDAEVHAIVDELGGLAQQGEDITTADVERLIGEATLDRASAADIARVSSHLAAGGWPLADDPDLLGRP